MLNKFMIQWNGISSDSLGVIVMTSESNNRPQRKIESINVPGRNGDVIFVQDAWENIERSYDIIAGGKYQGSSPIAYRAIAEWLYSPKGYTTLQDSSEPDYFFRAYFKGPFDVENQLARYGKAKISFICRPERFMSEGENQLTYGKSQSFTALNARGSYTKTSNHYPEDGTGICELDGGNLAIHLENPTPFNAQPYFYLYGADRPTMLDMSGRTPVTSYVPEKQPSNDDNYFPYLDRPSVYVGMWGQGNNPDFRIDGSLFTNWVIENSTHSYENARLKASKGAGSGQIGMNVEVSPNTQYGISWSASASASVVCGVSLYTGRGKYIKTVWGDRNTKLCTFTTTGATYYAVVVFQFSANVSNAYIEEIQMQAVDWDEDPSTPKPSPSAMSYTEPSEDNTAVMTIENTATGVVTTMTFNDIDDFMRVDCNTMNVYRNNNQNRNNDVFIDTLEFPVLTPGENIITLGGHVQAVGIRPRWWTL